MTARFASALYVTEVAHRRLRPRRHALAYRVCAMLIDLDELPELDRRLRLFAHGRFAPFSFHDRDYGARDGTPLRAWIEARLAEARLGAFAASIRTLTVPRLFGYAFNPITVHFCHGGDGGLGAILYEVHNTFGERHGYLLPVDRGALARGAAVEHSCAKDFHVSPFMDMELAYDFTVRPPGDRLSVAIRVRDEAGVVLTATQAGGRVELTDGALARALAAFPAQTLKIVAAIHWEAVRLFFKRIGVRPHRPASAPDVTARPAPFGAPRGTES
ncbi:MAG: DUF1365 family protein [Hyphomicrobiales bacterium]|nr:DUF1365 family protein [Hyphomicrobiales bacterium]MDE2016184.1 DUF1365 family protein [Hyphomicrobiales bacterium]